MKSRLLFTGGHHNSALAVIKWLLRFDSDIKIDWVGDQYPKNGVIYPEYKEVSDLSIPYHKIVAGKLFRFTNPVYLPMAIVSLVKIPLGFFKGFFILLTVRPNLIVSFGGFIAVPIVVVGKLLGIRSVTHEQTVVVGFANKIIGKFVDKIYVSWPVEFYKVDVNLKNKMVYTGLPVDFSFLKSNKKIDFHNKNKTIYITGGKKGSAVLNEAIYSNLDVLSSKFNIIWSCGSAKGDFDFEKIREQKNIYVKEYFFGSEVGEVFNTCDFVISRSGAHTVYELAMLKKPCVLVPIPWSSNGEQQKNAELLRDIGLAEIIDEDALLHKDFAEKIIKFSDTLEKRVKSSDFSSLSDIVTEKGQENLGNEIIKILKA